MNTALTPERLEALEKWVDFIKWPWDHPIMGDSPLNQKCETILALIEMERDQLKKELVVREQQAQVNPESDPV